MMVCESYHPGNPYSYHLHNIVRLRYQRGWSLWCTVYTRVQVERVYKSNPSFEAENTAFLEKVCFF